jgi:oxalate decarboxylase
VYYTLLSGDIDDDAVKSPYGSVGDEFFYDLLGAEPVLTDWGSVRVVDSTKFPMAKRIAAALVEVVPGGIRELHWHPLADEWQYFISGVGRQTVFASGDTSRTFDVRANTVGYIPAPWGHYIQNTGNTTLRFLEMFHSNIYSDVSLMQWLALSPIVSQQQISFLYCRNIDATYCIFLTTLG